MIQIHNKALLKTISIERIIKKIEGKKEGSEELKKEPVKLNLEFKYSICWL